MTPAGRERALAALERVQRDGLERSAASLELSMRTLDGMWNGALPAPRTGLVLVVFPLGVANTRGNFVANCARAGVGGVLRSVALRIGGARQVVEGDLFFEKGEDMAEWNGETPVEAWWHAEAARARSRRRWRLAAWLAAATLLGALLSEILARVLA